MRYYSSVIAFLIAVTFVPGISGAATSPRWAVAALSLWFMDWRVIPFVSFCFWAVDFDSAVHWAIICGAFSWGLKHHEDREVIWVVSGFSLGVAVSGIVAIMQVAGWDGVQQLIHPGGLFLNKNFMGEAACLALVMALQYRLWPVAVFLLPPLLLSGSRASFLATYLVSFFFLSRRFQIGMLFFGAAIVLVAWKIGATNNVASMDQRLMIWSMALPELKIFGSGAYDYSTILHREPNLHNDWLQLIYEFGIIGLVPMAAVYLSAINGALPFVMVLVVIATFGFPFHLPATAWFIAFVIGAMVGRNSDERRALLCPWLAKEKLSGFDKGASVIPVH